MPRTFRPTSIRRQHQTTRDDTNDMNKKVSKATLAGGKKHVLGNVPVNTASSRRSSRLSKNDTELCALTSNRTLTIGPVTAPKPKGRRISKVTTTTTRTTIPTTIITHTNTTTNNNIGKPAAAPVAVDTAVKVVTEPRRSTRQRPVGQQQRPEALTLKDPPQPVEDNNTYNNNNNNRRRSSSRSATRRVSSVAENDKKIKASNNNKKDNSTKQIKSGLTAAAAGRGRTKKRSNSDSSNDNDGNSVLLEPKPKKIKKRSASNSSKRVSTASSSTRQQAQQRGKNHAATASTSNGSRSVGSQAKSVATVARDTTTLKGTEPTRRKMSNDEIELCDDFLKTTNYELQRPQQYPDEEFDASKYTHGIASYDFCNRHDVLQVPEYVTDLYQRLYNAETKFRPRTYMDYQWDINPKMRAILIDWLVEVHMKFRLRPETLFLCVSIIDRYLQIKKIHRTRLQLVGVTSLLLACKFEEIYPPEVRDCVYITDRAYTRQELLDMEQDIVKELKFNMTVPTAYPFLVRFLHITDAGNITKYAASYYLERTLQEHDSLAYRPSLLAAAATTLALNHDEIQCEDEPVHGEREVRGVPNVLLEYSKFTKSEIISCAKYITTKVREEVTTASRRQLVAVKKKYDNTKYYSVSTDYSDPNMTHINMEDL